MGLHLLEDNLENNLTPAFFIHPTRANKKKAKSVASPEKKNFSIEVPPNAANLQARYI